MLTHRNLWMNATTFGWHAGISDRDRFLHVVPIFHCNGWGMPFALAAMGATQVMLRKAVGAEILRRIDAHGITFLGAAPAVVNAVLDAQEARGGKAPGHGTTRILVAGAPPPTSTGDGGSMDEGAYVSISDRKKDVIITGGENVSSIEIEDCLMSHAAIAEAAVIGVPDERWGETVKALVVLRVGTEASEADLIAHCRAHLAHYKCPTSVELRDTLARTATGKLQKFVLRAPYWAGRARQIN